MNYQQFLERITSCLLGLVFLMTMLVAFAFITLVAIIAWHCLMQALTGVKV